MYEYKAELVRVVDGDTVDLMVDLGFSVKIKERFRLEGIDAPESRTRDLEEKARGLAATEHLKLLIGFVPDGELKVQTEKDTKGKYGRYIGTLFGEHSSFPGRININDTMVVDGHAIRKSY